MKKNKGLVLSSVLLSLLIVTSSVFAVEVAPRISDREIIEKLSALDAKIDKAYSTLDAKIDREIANVRGDIKELKAGQIALQQQINDLKESTNKRFDAVDKRFDDMNSRFDDLRWMLSLFITIALVILGFVLRMQWQMHRRQTQVETTLETQKDELSFLKTLIEKLLPPKGVL
ncbi:MAG: hypothetical protein HY097_06300 [Nitrospinae bacterium]|nr:hypothetical protein [Nitrospinota bacterium]MBI3813069.1 hypothetical protein [Nitrospinota bacterium]